ncbi:MAG TPA: hypothetical protein VE008_07450 [Burkholderiales bacterium]|nr:hypothetical protein [Burkholderiales bacterium]
MIRASYRAAVFWIAANDDTEWLEIVRDGRPDPISVSAALVIDLFGVDEAKFRADLRREIDNQRAKSP